MLCLARRLGVLRPRDLKSIGVARAYLRPLVEQGELLKTARGLYVVADATLTENHSLAEAAKLSPKAVICLLSALRDAWRDKKATSEELWHHAKLCRVLNVMLPYFDSLT